MLVNLWVKENQSGNIHQIGTDTHDSLELFDGVVHYVNMQSMSGTLGGDYVFVEAPDSDDYVSITPEQLRLNKKLLHKDLSELLLKKEKEEVDFQNEAINKFKDLIDLIRRRAGNKAVYTFDFKSMMLTDCFWYNSGRSIANIWYRGYNLFIEVAGDVSAYFQIDTEDGECSETLEIRRNAPFDTIKANYPPILTEYIKNDYDLKKFEDEGLFGFEMNSWLNASVIHDETEERYKDTSFPVGENILDALLQHVESFFDYVDECIAQNVVWADGAPNWMN